MTKWRYGDAGDRIPVEVGQLWGCGPHRLLCGDLERKAAEHLLFWCDPPDLVYCDPPWDKGNARSFRTKSGVDGEQGNAVDFVGRLLPMIVEAARHAPEAWIEMGNRHIEDLRIAIEASGGTVRRNWPITYYQTKPCRIVAATWGPGHAQTFPDLTGLDDDDTPVAVLQSRDKGIVYDPCTGRGGTAVAAHNAGWTFIGTELAPRRMAVALDKLAKLGAGTPELIQAEAMI